MNIQEGVALAPYTTFHIGGPARYFAEASSVEDVATAVIFAEKNGLPLFGLGGGSNILVSDDGFDGLVLRLTNESIEWQEETAGKTLAISDAGLQWDAFVACAVMRGLHGVENLSGIPGTVGASAVQNIGAYGAEAGELIAWVEVYDRTTHTVRQLSHDECAFAYRDSIFKHNEGSGLIITRVAYRLSAAGVLNINYKDLIAYNSDEKPLHTIHDIREAVLAIRSRKFPGDETIGTAGSFFKNPVVSEGEGTRFLERYPDAVTYPASSGNIKLSAAWIIDHVLHMKGEREGDVGTWGAQALVLINYGKATARDVASFASRIIERAQHETHITLEREVIYVGVIDDQK